MPGERDFVRSRRENFDGSSSERGRERSETSRLWRDPNDNGTPRGFDALSARASTARRAEEEETPRKTDPRTSRRRSARARARVFGNDRFGWKNPSRPIRSGRRVEEHTRVRSARKTVFIDHGGDDNRGPTKRECRPATDRGVRARLSRE